jgi:[acyl-carrier-protein] S-malonyltransferase
MKPFAFVFPGQGSQSVGMLDAWGDHSVVRAVLDEASQALREDIGALIREGSKEALALTTNTQPVMLVAGIAAYRVWMAEVGIAPQAVAGHSLGEYAALVAAGAMTLADAVPLVRLRGQAMQEAVPVGQGAMAAILGMDPAQVAALCAEVAAEFSPESGEVVEAANFNDKAQTVISGSKAAVERACEVLKVQGAKRALLLPVSAPFHCALMRPAALILRERLRQIAIASPQIPLINNIDVMEESDPERIRDALYRQAFGPVRWVQTVQSFKARGLEHIVECGPGKVLSGMVKRIDASLGAFAVFDPATLAETQAGLQ